MSSGPSSFNRKLPKKEAITGEHVKKKDENVTWNPISLEINNVWWSFGCCGVVKIS